MAEDVMGGRIGAGWICRIRAHQFTPKSHKNTCRQGVWGKLGSKFGVPMLQIRTPSDPPPILCHLCSQSASFKLVAVAQTAHRAQKSTWRLEVLPCKSVCPLQGSFGACPRNSFWTFICHFRSEGPNDPCSRASEFQGLPPLHEQWLQKAFPESPSWQGTSELETLELWN